MGDLAVSRMVLRGFVLLVGYCCLSACGGAENRAAEHLQKGLQHVQAGDHEKARVEFKNVLQIAPDHLEGKLHLAETLEQLGELRLAIGQYRQILGIQENHPQASLRMAELLYAANEPEKAREIIDGISTTAILDEVRLEALLAALQFTEGERQAAVKRLEDLLEKHPHAQRAVLLLATLYQQDGQSDQAVHLLADHVRVNPDHMAVRLSLASLLVDQRNLEGAIREYRAVVDGIPESTTHRIKLAGLYLANGQQENALAVLRENITRSPQSLPAKLALITFLSTTRGVDEASQSLRGMIESSPADLKLRLALAELLMKVGRSDQGKQVYQEIISGWEGSPEALTAQNQMARIWIAENQEERAQTAIASVLQENPRDRDALLLRAGLALRNGQAGAAIADLRTLLKDFPRDIEILTQLANAHQANGETELATDAWRNLLSLYPNDTSLRGGYAGFLATRGDHGAASEQLELALEQAPDDTGLLELLVESQLRQQLWKKAGDTAERLVSRNPENPLAHYLAGLAKLGQQDADEALREFEKSLQLAPTGIEPLARAVDLLIRKEQSARALAILEEALDRQPGHFFALHLKGRVLRSLGREVEALAAYRQALRQKPDWPQPYLGIAELQFGKDPDAAVALLREGLSATGGDTTLVVYLAALLEQRQDLSGAITTLEESYRKQPQSLVLANNLAMLLLEDPARSAEKELLDTLARGLEKSDNPAFVDTAAWIYTRSGDHRQAIELLSPLLETHPEVAEFHYHLGIALKNDGKTEAAREHLFRALQSGRDFRGRDGAEQALAELSPS